MDGVPGSQVKDELIAIGARRDGLARQLESAHETPPLLHPRMADLYREKVTSLAEALEQPDSRPEATETLRGLIDEIVLTPDDGQLRIELRGNLAAMLGAAQPPSRAGENGRRASASLAEAFGGGGKAKRSPETCDLWVMRMPGGVNLRPPATTIEWVP